MHANSISQNAPAFRQASNSPIIRPDSSLDQNIFVLTHKRLEINASSPRQYQASNVGKNNEGTEGSIIHGLFSPTTHQTNGVLLTPCYERIEDDFLEYTHKSSENADANTGNNSIDCELLEEDWDALLQGERLSEKQQGDLEWHRFLEKLRRNGHGKFSKPYKGCI